MKARGLFHRSIGCLLLSLLLVLGLRGEILTIATYNVENYGPANRMTDAGYRQDYPKPEAEKRALRTVIRELNADVLVLQEMGGKPYLDELRRDLKDIQDMPNQYDYSLKFFDRYYRPEY